MTPLPETNPVENANLEPDYDPPQDEEQGFIPVLKNQNFLILWGGQVFSQIADKVYLVMAIALVANQFQAEGQSISGWVSAITIAFTIPAVLFGFIAGVMVDRWHKKDVLVNSNVLRGLFVLMLPILVWLSEGQTLFGGIPLGFIMLLAITLLVSTLTQFFAPAEQAAIPLLVQRRHLLSANSLYTTTMMASVIIGFAVGEPVLAFANQLLGNLNYSEELVVGGSYVISGILLMLMRLRERINIQERAQTKVWQDLKTGLAVLRDSPSGSQCPDSTDYPLLCLCGLGCSRRPRRGNHARIASRTIWLPLSSQRCRDGRWGGNCRSNRFQVCPSSSQPLWFNWSRVMSRGSKFLQQPTHSLSNYHYPPRLCRRLGCHSHANHHSGRNPRRTAR